MTSSINAKRMLLVINKYQFENRKAFGLMLLAIGAFLVLWMGVQLAFTNPNLFKEEVQLTYYFTGLFLSGCLSAGIHFSHLSSKPRAIHYLLTPASSAEKFICTLFFSVFLFFVGYTLIFYTIDIVAVLLANIKFKTHWTVVKLYEMNQYENRIFEGPISSFLYIYFTSQAFFLLASIYFKKHGLFKAIIGVGVIWVLAIFLSIAFLSSFPIGRFYSGIDVFEIAEVSGINRQVVLPLLVTMSITVFYKFLLTPLLWLTVYLRIKEKQL